MLTDANWRTVCTTLPVSPIDIAIGLTDAVHQLDTQYSRAPFPSLRSGNRTRTRVRTRARVHPAPTREIDGYPQPCGQTYPQVIGTTHTPVPTVAHKGQRGS